MRGGEEADLALECALEDTFERGTGMGLRALESGVGARIRVWMRSFFKETGGLEVFWVWDSISRLSDREARGVSVTDSMGDRSCSGVEGAVWIDSAWEPVGEGGRGLGAVVVKASETRSIEGLGV